MYSCGGVNSLVYLIFRERACAAFGRSGGLVGMF